MNGTVVAVKAQLTAAGLATGGVKAALVARLVAHKAAAVEAAAAAFVPRRREDYARVTIAYFDAMAAAKLGETEHEKFRATPQFEKFKAENTGYSGPCYLLSHGTIFDWPYCNLHGEMSIIKHACSATFKENIRSQASDGLPVLLRFAHSWMALGEPHMHTAVVKAIDLAMSEGKATTFIFRLETPEEERRPMTGDAALVRMYVTRMATRGEVLAELADLCPGDTASAKKMRLPELRGKLTGAFTAAMQAGSIPRWVPFSLRSRLADGGAEMTEYLSKHSQRVDGEAHSLLSAEAQMEIVNKVLSNMTGGACKKIVNGGYRVINRYLNRNATSNLHASVTANHAKATEAVADLMADRAVIVAKSNGAELSVDEVQALEDELYSIDAAIAAAVEEEGQADRDEVGFRDRLDLDETTKLHDGLWEKLAAWMCPMMGGDRRWTGVEHKAAYDVYQACLRSNFGDWGGSYEDYYERHLAGDIERCRQMFNGAISVANFSAQRTECAGK
jgi:hypothetical protein